MNGKSRLGDVKTIAVLLKEFVDGLGDTGALAVLRRPSVVVPEQPPAGTDKRQCLRGVSFGEWVCMIGIDEDQIGGAHEVAVVDMQRVAVPLLDHSFVPRAAKQAAQIEFQQARTHAMLVGLALGGIEIDRDDTAATIHVRRYDERRPALKGSELDHAIGVDHSGDRAQREQFVFGHRPEVTPDDAGKHAHLGEVGTRQDVFETSCGQNELDVCRDRPGGPQSFMGIQLGDVFCPEEIRTRERGHPLRCGLRDPTGVEHPVQQPFPGRK